MSVHYVLFASNTDAMMLDALLRQAHIPARITPTPHDLQKLAGCGVAILVEEEQLEPVQECIRQHQIPHHSIVSRPQPINPKRDRFC